MADTLGTTHQRAPHAPSGTPSDTPELASVLESPETTAFRRRHFSAADVEPEDLREQAASLVTGMQMDVSAEAAARGRILRQAADLHLITLRATFREAQEQREVLQRRPGGTSPRDVDSATLTEIQRWAQEDARSMVVGELELALKLPRGSAMELLRQALVLTQHLPHVLEQLEAGQLLWDQVKVILNQWSSLTETHFPDCTHHLSALNTSQTLAGTEVGDLCDVAPDADPPETPGTAPVDESAEADANNTGHHLTGATSSASALEPPPAPLGRFQAAGERLVVDMMERAQQCGAAKLNAYGHRRRHAMGAPAQARAHQNAKRHRGVWVEPEDDGMAHLHAILDAATALAACDRIDRLAQNLNDSPGSATATSDDHQANAPKGAYEEDTRSGEPVRRGIGERRADVLADLLLEAEPSQKSELPRGIRGQVSVIVPVEHLVAADPTLVKDNKGSAPGPARRVPATDADTAARSEGKSWQAESPELIGYGPISPLTAVELASGSASWKRLLLDPGTGEITQFGRQSYKVPAGLRRQLQIRDATCRFPGCRRAAERCDVDHALAWEDGGTTDAENLAHLCRAHHLLKHQNGPFGSWHVTPQHVLPQESWGTSAPDNHSSPTNNVGSAMPSPGNDGSPANGANGANGIMFTSPLGTTRHSSVEHSLFATSDSATSGIDNASGNSEAATTHDVFPEDPPPF
ncbi:HNH endonuclease signature motif containing protein [Kocuria sp.]|uniref:HNH endonuclease signature motif containing protein n=1 Tax=Kocuria sp. TaxID=1871328 RepID=UPI0026DF704A|nr:HNH endonuclease signature motif containing protein [Kocuria sp.]MDO5617482.1 DUF222 domain-containing protein [Kocuria sp.]